MAGVFVMVAPSTEFIPPHEESKCSIASLLLAHTHTYIHTYSHTETHMHAETHTHTHTHTYMFFLVTAHFILDHSLMEIIDTFCSKINKKWISLFYNNI